MPVEQDNYSSKEIENKEQQEILHHQEYEAVLKKTHDKLSSPEGGLENIKGFSEALAQRDFKKISELFNSNGQFRKAYNDSIQDIINETQLDGDGSDKSKSPQAIQKFLDRVMDSEQFHGHDLNKSDLGDIMPNFTSTMEPGPPLMINRGFHHREREYTKKSEELYNKLKNLGKIPKDLQEFVEKNKTENPENMRSTLDFALNSLFPEGEESQDILDIYNETYGAEMKNNKEVNSDKTKRLTNMLIGMDNIPSLSQVSGIPVSNLNEIQTSINTQEMQRLSRIIFSGEKKKIEELMGQKGIRDILNDIYCPSGDTSKEPCLFKIREPQFDEGFKDGEIRGDNSMYKNKEKKGANIDQKNHLPKEFEGMTNVEIVNISYKKDDFRKAFESSSENYLSYLMDDIEEKSKDNKSTENKKTDMDKKSPNAKKKTKLEQQNIQNKNPKLLKYFQDYYDQYPELFKKLKIPRLDENSSMKDISVYKVEEIFPNYYRLKSFSGRNGLENIFQNNQNISVTSKMLILETIQNQLKNPENNLNTPESKSQFIKKWSERIKKSDDASVYNNYKNNFKL